MRTILKRLVSLINSSYFERLIVLSLFREQFSKLRHTPNFSNREDLWENVFKLIENKSLSVIEFGVWEGYSMSKFAELNTNPDSKFYGFDSFEGLPEYWKKEQLKGEFDTGGEAPILADGRISFHKGWFQNTLPSFVQNFDSNEILFVHYDADIFSTTLFAMLEIDRLKKPYFAVFDEFTGHETRAL